MVKLPRVIFVLDRSGSMGAWVGYGRRALQAALQQLGFPEETPFCFITFESRTELIKVDGNRYPTVFDLDKRTLNHINSSGSTCMSGVMPHLLAELQQPGHSSFAIVVVSDGCIDSGDVDRTINAAQRAATELGVSSVPIHGVLLRTMTSRQGY